MKNNATKRFLGTRDRCIFCERSLRKFSSIAKAGATSTPLVFFTTEQRKQQTFKFIENKLGITKPTDWYKFRFSDVNKVAPFLPLEFQKSNFVFSSNSQLINTLKEYYPEIEWNDFQFVNIRNNALGQTKQHVLIFNLLEKELGIKRLEDWYAFSLKDVKQAATRLGIMNKVHSLISNHYDNKLQNALKKIYPEFEWDPVRFVATARRALESEQFQRRIFDIVQKELGVKKPEDWYKFSGREAIRAAENAGVSKNFTSILTVYYGKSFIRALKNLYPEYNLQEIKFRRGSLNSFKDLTVLKSMVATVEQKLFIKDLADWYRISQYQMQQISKFNLVKKGGGLSTILPSIYPNYAWDLSKLKDRHPFKKASQRLLRAYVNELLGKDGTEVIEDFLSEFCFSRSNERVELDLYIPRYKLAFEYNGIQHYKDIGIFATAREYQLRDQEKQRLCNENDITLITFSYLQDLTLESVKKAIQERRPDIKM